MTEQNNPPEKGKKVSTEKNPPDGYVGKHQKVEEKNDSRRSGGGAYPG